MNIEDIDIIKDFCNIKILYGRELCLLEEQLISYQSAIETLLTAYEKEKEKNMELTNSYNKAIKETNEENRKCMLLAVENQDLKDKYSDKKIRNTVIKRYKEVIEKDYISKAKIKAKIEELNKELEEYKGGREWEIQDEIMGQIEVLQSLLEEKE